MADIKQVPETSIGREGIDGDDEEQPVRTIAMTSSGSNWRRRTVQNVTVEEPLPV